MNRVFRFLSFLAGVLLFAGGAHANRVLVGEFSKSDLDGWAEKVFYGKTSYSLATLRNKMVLKAESSSSASGLFKKTLDRYPEISLLELELAHRKSARHYASKDLKSDDDYAARVYVVIDGGLLLWRTRR